LRLFISVLDGGAQSGFTLRQASLQEKEASVAIGVVALCAANPSCRWSAPIDFETELLGSYIT